MTHFEMQPGCADAVGSQTLNQPYKARVHANQAVSRILHDDCPTCGDDQGHEDDAPERRVRFPGLVAEHASRFALQGSASRAC